METFEYRIERLPAMIQKRGWLFFLLAVLLTIASCTGTKPGLFTKKTPHAAYLAALQDMGLTATAMGKLWQQAAVNSLAQPIGVGIPYKETGYFEPSNPRAVGYQVRAKRGEQLIVQLSTQPAGGSLLFAELWRIRLNQPPQLLVAADTLQSSINYTVEQEGDFIIRLQPELLQGIGYTLTISTGPSLAFPLHKNDKPRVISVWGVDRDAGARRHEGIDILVKKRTPAIAAAAGVISSAGENTLGGKVIFLRPDAMNMQLYYAHLDTQWVQAGNRVRVGDTLGLTGNTGNAKNTISHLHFGIYADGGAKDPLPYIQTDRPVAPPISADTAFLNRYARVQQTDSIAAGSVAKIISATGNRYQLELPNGRRQFAGMNKVSLQPKPIQLPQAAVALFDRPAPMSAIKTTITPGATVMLLGYYTDYAFISWNNSTGWIQPTMARINKF